MLRDDLISIIVPVYNVEDYLERCIHSILNQTYKHLEIVVVDDGSTDRSGMACDEYEKQDSRIKVIHKANGGLASARNAGLDVATGSYIGFVDSDDYIDEDMYAELYYKCIKYDLDVVAARFVPTIDGRDEILQTTKEFQIFSGETMLRINLFGHEKYVVTSSVWDRLYKADVIKNLRFPDGRKYEDICFSTYAFLKAYKCGYYDKILYHYTIRDDSIMGMGARNKSDVSTDFFDDFVPQMRDQIIILENANFSSLAERVRYNLYCEFLSKYMLTLKNKHQKQIGKRIINEAKKDGNKIIYYCWKNDGFKSAVMATLFYYATWIIQMYWKAKNIV